MTNVSHRDKAEWEGRADGDIAILIKSCLIQHPPPDDCERAEGLSTIADDLLEFGGSQLADLHRRPLQSLAGGGA